MSSKETIKISESLLKLSRETTAKSVKLFELLTKESLENYILTKDNERAFKLVRKHKDTIEQNEIKYKKELLELQGQLKQMKLRLNKANYA